jgi:branched-chain amino acid transport system substrate-binding protein
MRAPAAPAPRATSSLNFNAAGTNFPVIQDILKHVVEKGKSQVASDKVGENLYNRGVYNSMLMVEAIRNAQKLTGKKVVTAEDMRRGFETLTSRKRG